MAADLFKEWEKELEQISSASLRESSRNQLQETRRRYDELHAGLKRAERCMDPVLARFKDQVLYLKHNLNAEAIASLKGGDHQHPDRDCPAHQGYELRHRPGG